MSNTVNKAVIGVGSNIDPDKHIPQAQVMLEKHVDVLSVSTFVKTAPIGYKDQPDFTNGAILIGTPMAPDRCRETLKSIETALGRQRSNNKFGPRTIDLDIIVWNDEVCDDEFYERDFVRNAVLEICPHLS